jgi:hypothetical protein
VGVPVAVGRGVIVAPGVAVSITIKAVTGMDGAEGAVLVWVVEAVADSSTWDELFAGKDGVATGRVPGADDVPTAPEIGRQAISADIARYTHNNCCMSNSCENGAPASSRQASKMLALHFLLHLPER